MTGKITAVFLLITLAATSPAMSATRTSTFAPADPGVRATAMGGAFTALGGEPTALYWNPATLFYQQGRSLEASYADMYGLGIARRSFVTYGVKTVIEEPQFDDKRITVRQDRESGAAYAFGVQSLFLDLDANSYSELSLGGAAAWGYGERLAAGISVRALFVSSDLDNVSAVGYNLGLGFAYRYSQHERLALSVPSLLSRLFWDFDSTERLPLGASLGWSREFHDMDLVMSAEVEVREEEESPYRIALGGEWWAFPERLALRGGFRHVTGTLNDIDKPTFGVGVLFSQLRFDYAFRLEPDALGDTHRLGLLFNF